MVITLKVVTDIYAKPDKNGKQKLIKRNQEYLKQFDSNQILVEQYLSSKGIPSKKYSLVKEGDTYFKVNHKFEELEKLNKHIKVNGFKNT